MNFVAEYTAMAAPWSNGRTRNGETVLSRISGTPARGRRATSGSDVELRIADRLGVEGARLGVGGRPTLGSPIDERHLPIDSRRVVEQVVGAAVEVIEATMSSPARAMFRIGTEAADHADRQRADAAVELGDALLEHVRRRVHDARVDIAELVQTEQVEACSVSRNW